MTSITRLYWSCEFMDSWRKNKGQCETWLLCSVKCNSSSTQDKPLWFSSWNQLGKKRSHSPINLRLLRWCSWNDCLALLSVFLADMSRRDDSKAYSICLSSQGLQFVNKEKLHKPTAIPSSGNSASSSDIHRHLYPCVNVLTSVHVHTY